MIEIKEQAKHSKLLALAGIIIIAGALHLARDIFIPVAVAVLLSFLLAPMVGRFAKWGLPNVAAVLTTVGIAFSILGVVGWLVSAQFINLVRDLPEYQENLRAKIASFKKPRDGVFSRAGKTLTFLKKEIEKESAEEASAHSTQPAAIAVKIEQPAATPLELLKQYAGPLLGPVGTAGISLIFVIFILLQRNDLRDRFVKLVSGGNMNRATHAVDDAAQRITKYLMMQMIINVTYGIPLGIGLYLIGVPNALLWGLLAALLRFIPFVGPWIAAIFPVSLAFAIDPGWTMPLLAIGLVAVMELISNNVIEPWLYGSSTGISAVALIFAALVWAWIWGPVGLFLSTPLTVCLLVIGKNVPALGYLNVILGTEPVLTPEAQIYQRMLALDSESMLEVADKFLETETLANFYDRALIPALALAEQDRHAGALAVHRERFIIQSARDLIEDLGERYSKIASDAAEADLEADTTLTTPPDPITNAIICVPARDDADELTALMLVQILRQAGLPAECGTMDQSAVEIVKQGKARGTRVVCVCAIPPGAVTGTRKKCRQLREAGLRTKLIAGIWGTQDSSAELARRLASSCTQSTVATFTDAVAQIEKAAGVAPLMKPLEIALVSSVS